MSNQEIIILDFCFTSLLQISKSSEFYLHSIPDGYLLSVPPPPGSGYESDNYLSPGES
jgi:hypothetical protein